MRFAYVDVVLLPRVSQPLSRIPNTFVERWPGTVVYSLKHDHCYNLSLP